MCMWIPPHIAEGVISEGFWHDVGYGYNQICFSRAPQNFKHTVLERYYCRLVFLGTAVCNVGWGLIGEHGLKVDLSTCNSKVQQSNNLFGMSTILQLVRIPSLPVDDFDWVSALKGWVNEWALSSSKGVYEYTSCQARTLQNNSILF